MAPRRFTRNSVTVHSRAAATLAAGVLAAILAGSCDRFAPSPVERRPIVAPARPEPSAVPSAVRESTAGGVITAVPAASKSVRAVLLEGPFPGSGIPFLKPNALSYWVGRYQVADFTVSVYFTSQSIIANPAWTPHECDGKVLSKVLPVSKPSAGQTVAGAVPGGSAEVVARTVLYFSNSSKWSLFFEFPAAMGDDCPFVSTFINRFVYFYDSLYQEQSYATTREIPFPAILNL
ncbi:MAG TPA: hypothetical protein VMW87_13060 [Spirochaetia bacterium]|nr:hypothetical protein [Spirochaetia bacterium]